jgi:hypothetical protein
MGPELFKFPAENYLQVFTSFLAKVLYQERQPFGLNEVTVLSGWPQQYIIKFYSI